MYTVELGWFCFDLPDHADVAAITASPNPLFPDARVTTQWRIALGRFEMTALLSATRDLSDLSRAALDEGLRAEPFDATGLPGLRVGAYSQPRTRIEWWFTLNGLVLSLTLAPTNYAQVLPTDEERAEHAAIIDSVRRVSAD